MRFIPGSVLGVVCAMGVGLAQAGPAKLPRYRIVDLGQCNADWMSAAAISPGGRIVGYGQSESRQWTPCAWTRHAGAVPLPRVPGMSYTMATAVNDHGTVVGVAGDDAGTSDQTWNPVVWKHGRVRVVPLPDGYVQGAILGLDANDVGVGWICTGTCHDRERQGALFTDRGVLPITTRSQEGLTLDRAEAINDAGLIVGSALQSDSGSEVPFMVDSKAGVARTLRAGWIGQATAVSQAGHVAGQATSASWLGPYPFLWSKAGGWVNIPMPPDSTEGSATSVNSSGVVVGWTADPDRWISQSFLFDGQKTYSFDDLVPAGTGWTSVSALAINDAGVIVGNGVRAGQTHALALVPRKD